MLEVIKKLVKSSKFWVAVVGGAVTAGMSYAGVDPETITKVWGVILTLLGAMGLADLGKNAPPK